MDNRLFDSIARTLASQSSRRRALGAIAASALGLGVSRQASARTCSERNTVCREGSSCCTGICVDEHRGRKVCAYDTSFFVSARVGADGVGFATGVAVRWGTPAFVSATDADANCNVNDNPRACFDGPNGRGSFDPNALAPNLNLFSLIARVGNGPWVYVGAGLTPVTGNGQLFLAYNDVLTQYHDNSGGFNVTVGIL